MKIIFKLSTKDSGLTFLADFFLIILSLQSRHICTELGRTPNFWHGRCWFSRRLFRTDPEPQEPSSPLRPFYWMRPVALPPASTAWPALTRVSLMNIPLRYTILLSKYKSMWPFLWTSRKTPSWNQCASWSIFGCLIYNDTISVREKQTDFQVYVQQSLKMQFPKTNRMVKNP